MNRRSFSLRLTLAGVLVLGLSVPAFAVTRDQEYQQANELRGARKFDEAVAAYEALLKKPDCTPQQQATCYWSIIDCRRQQKKPAEALAAVDKLLAVLPPEDSGLHGATETRADLLVELGRREDAARYAIETAGRFAQDPDYAAAWHQRSGHLWFDLKRYSEAAEQLSSAAELAKKGGNLRRAADTLWTAAEAMWTAKELDKSAAFARQVSELNSPDVPPDLRFAARNRMGEALLRQDRPVDARAMYQSFLTGETNTEFRQRWWMTVARLFQNEKNTGAALDALEHVITGQAGKVGYGHWFEAQWMIADVLAQSGDLNASLQAARVCLDVADNRDRVSQSADRVSQLLQQIDKKPDRAKAFMAFQRGETKDNPLESPLVAPSPDRMKAFAVAETQLGTDAQAMVQRGLMRAYLGQHKEACALLLEACRRAVGEDVGPAYSALLFVGVRGVRGNAVELDSFARFLAFGPGRADGKSNLSDPFAALQLPPAAVQMPADQQQTLAELRQRLERIAEDTNWPEEGRRDAFRGLQRVHSALGDWGDPAVFQWYQDCMAREKDIWTQESMFAGVLAAARQGQAHWGSTLQYLANRGTLAPQLQKAVETLSKRREGPMLTVQQMEEQTRLTSIFRR